MRTGLPASALLACLLVGLPARAAEPDDAGTDRAVRLATEADKRWAAEDYAAALQLFREARELVKAPTLRFREAECLEKLGRWIQAVYVYRDVARTPLSSDAPEPFRKVVEDAHRRGAALAGRVPTLRIALSGVHPSAVRVEVDGRDIPRETWTEAVVDPGPHVVVAVADDGRRRSKTAQAVEGRATTVQFSFGSAGARQALDDDVPSRVEQQGREEWYGGSVAAAYAIPMAMGLGIGAAAGAASGNAGKGAHAGLAAASAVTFCVPAAIHASHENPDSATGSFFINFVMSGTGVGLSFATCSNCGWDKAAILLFFQVPTAVLDVALLARHKVPVPPHERAVRPAVVPAVSVGGGGDLVVGVAGSL